MLLPMKALKSPLAKQLLANRTASAQLRRYVARSGDEAIGTLCQPLSTTVEWQDGARTLRDRVTRVPKAG